MATAKTFAELSHAERLKVGAIIVKDDRIISIGYNGMPSGWDNSCEIREFMRDGGGWLSLEEIEETWPFRDENNHRYRLRTKAEVLHAETNAIAKLAKSNESGDGASIFITHSPCIECSKLIYQSGISNVYYLVNYRDNAGLDFLKKSDVIVEQLSE